MDDPSKLPFSPPAVGRDGDLTLIQMIGKLEDAIGRARGAGLPMLVYMLEVALAQAYSDLDVADDRPSFND